MAEQYNILLRNGILTMNVYFKLQEAVLLLTSKGQKDGMFIVRHSSRQSSCFVLTMIYELHPYNFEIQNVVS